jgi:V/A-type H+-transporting ATPase subunit F
MCFKAFGADVFPTSDLNFSENKKILNSLSGYGCVFITEQTAEGIEETIERFNKRPTPIITLIPSVKGSTGAGLAKIRNNVEKAVGINILDESR